MDDVTATAPTTELAADRATPTGDTMDDTTEDTVLEELLVEEISIDGMCGVY